jgi:hypothetical protein
MVDFDAYEHIGRTVATSLGARARALELLLAGRSSAATETDALAGRLQALRRDPLNIVILAPRRAGDAVRATMRIDEQHPYFFDHPLDHVPGILLIEGVLQLVELAATRSDGFVSAISVRFRRYTEKGPPITVEAVPGADGRPWKVSIEQSGHVVCECSVSIAQVPPPDLQGVAAIDDPAPPARALLHKSRDENVLVGAIEDHPRGLRVRTLPIPSDHCVADGHRDRLSMLYFLEIARQCLMLVVHTRLGVPLGVPMSLLSLEFGLRAPIPRDTPLVLVPDTRADPWNGLVQTSRFGTKLYRFSDADGPGEPLGTVTIFAQVIDKQLYHRQRRSGG